MIRQALVLAFSASLLGCAGASTEVIAPGAKVPISLSRSVRDADGKIVPLDQQEVVGHFEEKSTAWGMVYSYAKLTPRTDISEPVNAQVDRAKGEAIVHLAIRSKPCALDFVEVLNWLPFWPGCSNLTMTGDIIRLKRPIVPVILPAPLLPDPTPPAATTAASEPAPAEPIAPATPTAKTKTKTRATATKVKKVSMR